MARGRFLSKKIAVSEQLGSVSLLADHLFTKCLPHLDREGRITASPAGLKALAVPLRPEITVENIPNLLAELAAAHGPEGEPLLHLYDSRGRPAAYFPGFARSQQGLRMDREAPSQFTEPPAYSRENAGVPEDNSRENAAQVKGSKGKLREGTSTDLGNLAAQVSGIFTDSCGPCSPGEAGAALASQADTFTPDEIVRAAGLYVLQSTDKPQYKTVRNFAKQLPQWVRQSAPIETHTESGDISAEFRAAIGARL